MKIRAWALAKVPMIHYARPKVVESSADEVRIVIPLRRRTKNHWNSMYFGALAVGADLAAGLLAMNCIEKSGGKVSLVFKDFQAEFLKRPEGAVEFRCLEGQAVQEAVREAIASGERVTIPVGVEAWVGEKVAQMSLGLSLKIRA